MIRIAVVFLVAVFLPSVVLGVLALRTAGEQQGILERQTATLYQNETDVLATGLGDAILGRQREFARTVRDALAESDPRLLAWEFGGKLNEEGVAFVIDPGGVVITDEARGMDAEAFIASNRSFLSNASEAEVFPTTQSVFSNAVKGKIEGVLSKQSPTADAENQARARQLDQRIRDRTEDVEPSPPSRKVAPTSRANAPEPPPSKLASQVSNFQSATATGTDGVLARFTRNGLELILWTRPPEAAGHVFALALPAELVSGFVREAFSALAPAANSEVALAVLDENARPVARTVPDFETNWKEPFVATEIGELLPHWEVALYLREPGRLVESARLVTLTLVLLIGIALAAILAGCVFVAWEVRRQMQLAQRKTDFVSNVSHELKTPLTSIRMFAEILEKEGDGDEKRAKYLRIILQESERLTRLINNILDFARLEKKSRRYQKAPIDLYPILRDVWECEALRLRGAGFTCFWEAGDPPYQVAGDADSLAQVVMNLITNAEKYSGDVKEVTLRTMKEPDLLRIDVMDRGIGIRSDESERIYEAFHRSDDSLSSGVRGTGLGLALARRIVEDHNGGVSHRPRPGGGTIFTLTLPLVGDDGMSAEPGRPDIP